MYGIINKRDRAAKELHQDDIDAVSALYGDWSPSEASSCSVYSVGSKGGNIGFILMLVLFSIILRFVKQSKGGLL
jgi:hypothetical protein